MDKSKEAKTFYLIQYDMAAYMNIRHRFRLTPQEPSLYHTPLKGRRRGLAECVLVEIKFHNLLSYA